MKHYLKFAAYYLMRDLRIQVDFIRKDEFSFICNFFNKGLIKPGLNKYSFKIEQLAHKTNQLGSQHLWEGYNQNNASRNPKEVRTDWLMGNLFSEITRAFAPENILEIGTAFGISGMYWLAGLELNNKGQLYTFEPNKNWRDRALMNLNQIGKRVVSVEGTFEENASQYFNKGNQIDIAFLDAIHKREFVEPQLNLVLKHSSDHLIIFLDDIDFSDDMMDFWNYISQNDKFCASARLGGRVGVLEFRK